MRRIMLERKEVNQEIDCVIVDYPFVMKIHREILDEIQTCKFTTDPIISAITKVAEKYGAEPFNAGDTGFYLFRFKSEKDKLAFILKNV